MLLGVAAITFVPFCATGTSLLLATQIPQAVCELPFRFANGSPLPWVGQKEKTPRKVVFFLFGAPSGIRTRDPLIKSQLLYQLS